MHRCLGATCSSRAPRLTPPRLGSPSRGSASPIDLAPPSRSNSFDTPSEMYSSISHRSTLELPGRSRHRHAALLRDLAIDEREHLDCSAIRCITVMDNQAPLILACGEDVAACLAVDVDRGSSPRVEINRIVDASAQPRNGRTVVHHADSDGVAHLPPHQRDKTCAQKRRRREHHSERRLLCLDGVTPSRPCGGLGGPSATCLTPLRPVS